ncbi:predicted protein [Nematostella vectensis]|uniref:G-protein coupled receptors family 1 profile domain-containing protein n=1 Tax=Nematostella vectensis TaxID=45351 RepID=A7S828_NEMVE|nr:predicted protein [Nematostella vectensis]|eukprot:XP_001632181.1 predicted protein [Nematostella vectensis]
MVGTYTVDELSLHYKAILIVEGCIVALVNILAIVVLLRKSFRVKKATYFVLSMTVADLQAGVSCLLSAAGIAMRYAEMWLLIVLTASLFSLVAISIERTYAVFLPFKHRSSQGCSYIIWIVLINILSVCRMIYPLLARLSPQYDPLTDFIIWCAVSLTSLTIMIICYISIWVKMRFGRTFDPEQSSRNNAKLGKTLCIVNITTLVCFLPQFIILGMIDLNWWQNPHYFFFLFFLENSNSFWNVLVYSIRMPEFRRELREIFKLASGTGCRKVGPRQHDRSRDQSNAVNADPLSRDEPVLVLGNLQMSPCDQ